MNMKACLKTPWQMNSAFQLLQKPRCRSYKSFFWVSLHCGQPGGCQKTKQKTLGLKLHDQLLLQISA